MDRTGQKINMETKDLNNSRKQVVLINTHRTLHPTRTKYMLISRGHGKSSRIGHMLDHKVINGLDKTKYECIFTSLRAINLEVNKKRKFTEITNNVEIKQLTSK